MANDDAVHFGSAQEIVFTVHKLDRDFRDFPGNRPVEKIIAAHPILADLALSGATVTAGGLVFTALQDGWVVAYNDETLEELWRFNVGTALKGAPVTYAIGPRQYLAVQASGRHLHPVKYDNLQDSSYLFVFALN